MKNSIVGKYKEIVAECKANPKRKFEIIAVVLISLWYIYPLFFSDDGANTGIRANPSTFRVNVPFFVIGGIGFIVILICLMRFLKTINTSKLHIKVSGTDYTLIFLGALLIWEYISAFVCKNPNVTWSGNDGLMHYATYNVYFILAAFFITKRSNIIIVSEILVFVASILELIIFSESDFLMYIFHLHPAESIFFNQNLHGYYLTVVIPIALLLFIIKRSKKAIIIHSIELIFLSYGMIMAQSTGPLVAVIISLITLIIISAFRFKKELKCVVIGSLIIFISLSVFSLFIKANKAGTDILKMFSDFKTFFASTVSGNIESEEFKHIGSSRGKLWSAAIKIIKEKPIFGTGVCAPMFEEMERVCGKYITPHNEVLDYGVQFGIPAMIFYLGTLLSIFVCGVKMFKKLDIFTICFAITVMSYFISSMFGNVLYGVYPFFIIQLGICWNLVRAEEKKKKLSEE